MRLSRFCSGPLGPCNRLRGLLPRSDLPGAQQHTPCNLNRYVLLLIYAVGVMCTGPLYLNWPPVAELLFRNEAFASLCKKDPVTGAYTPDLRRRQPQQHFLHHESRKGGDEETGAGGKPYICDAQETAVQQLYPLCTALGCILSCLAGTVMDSYGPRLTAVGGRLLQTLGWLLLAFASASDKLYLAGLALYAIGLDGVVLPSLSVCRLFPASEGLIITVIGSALSASYAVPVVMKHLVEAYGVSLQAVALHYAFLCPFAYAIISFFFMPKRDFVRVGASEGEAALTKGGPAEGTGDEEDEDAANPAAAGTDGETDAGNGTPHRLRAAKSGSTKTHEVTGEQVEEGGGAKGVCLTRHVSEDAEQHKGEGDGYTKAGRSEEKGGISQSEKRCVNADGETSRRESSYTSTGDDGAGGTSSAVALSGDLPAADVGRMRQDGAGGPASSLGSERDSNGRLICSSRGYRREARNGRELHSSSPSGKTASRRSRQKCDTSGTAVVATAPRTTSAGASALTNISVGAVQFPLSLPHACTIRTLLVLLVMQLLMSATVRRNCMLRQSGPFPYGAACIAEDVECAIDARRRCVVDGAMFAATSAADAADADAKGKPYDCPSFLEKGVADCPSSNEEIRVPYSADGGSSDGSPTTKNSKSANGNHPVETRENTAVSEDSAREDVRLSVSGGGVELTTVARNPKILHSDSAGTTSFTAGTVRASGNTSGRAVNSSTSNAYGLYGEEEATEGTSDGRSSFTTASGAGAPGGAETQDNSGTLGGLGKRDRRRGATTRSRWSSSTAPKLEATSVNGVRSAMRHTVVAHAAGEATDSFSTVEDDASASGRFPFVAPAATPAELSGSTAAPSKDDTSSATLRKNPAPPQSAHVCALGSSESLSGQEQVEPAARFGKASLHQGSEESATTKTDTYCISCGRNGSEVELPVGGLRRQSSGADHVGSSRFCACRRCFLPLRKTQCEDRWRRLRENPSVKEALTQILSERYGLVLLYKVVTVIAATYYQESSIRMFHPRVIQVRATLLPFSFVLCIALGKAADCYGIMKVILLVNFFGFSTYFSSFFKVYSIAAEYVSVCSFVCYMALFTSQMIIYVENTFSPRHFGKLSGAITTVGGIVSMLAHPLYSEVTVKLNGGDTFYVRAALTVLLFLVYLVLIRLFILYKKNPHPYRAS